MKPCVVTGKRKYRHEIEAALALGDLQARPARRLRTGKVEVRKYVCEHCEFWHLTSQPIFEDRAVAGEPTSEEPAPEELPKLSPAAQAWYDRLRGVRL